jgi:hypothetical protein
MSVHDRFTHTKRMILIGLLIPWSVGLIIALTGAADHMRFFSTVGFIAVGLLMSAIACAYLFAFRCPRCRKSLAMISNRGGSQLFIRTHNETLSVVAIHISNERPVNWL